jgi:hypothetical protein
VNLTATNKQSLKDAEKATEQTKQELKPLVEKAHKTK